MLTLGLVAVVPGTPLIVHQYLFWTDHNMIDRTNRMETDFRNTTDSSISYDELDKVTK